MQRKVTKLLVDYFENDFRRITHALEVLKYAEEIIKDTDRCDYEVLIASVPSCMMSASSGLKRYSATTMEKHKKSTDLPLPKAYLIVLTSHAKRPSRFAR